MKPSLLSKSPSLGKLTRKLLPLMAMPLLKFDFSTLPVLVIILNCHIAFYDVSVEGQEREIEQQLLYESLILWEVECFQVVSANDDYVLVLVTEYCGCFSSEISEELIMAMYNDFPQLTVK
mmetsp:Transcript_8674/g.11267  ORF Transcript_8674/g.11267 Transcript_8674/m.11267 type:complete len:121 (+) Transcript_8674:398-760(+)